MKAQKETNSRFQCVPLVLGGIGAGVLLSQVAPHLWRWVRANPLLQRDDGGSKPVATTTASSESTKGAASILDVPDPGFDDPFDKKVFEQLKLFAFDPSLKELLFPPMSSEKRRRVHVISAMFHLRHKSYASARPSSGGKANATEEKEQCDVNTSTASKPKLSICRMVRVWKPPLWPNSSPRDTRGSRRRGHSSGAVKSKARRVPKKPLPEWDEESLEFYNQLKEWMTTTPESVRDFEYPPTMTASQRKKIHDVAEHLDLDHKSAGRRRVSRFIRVSKVDPAVLEKRKQQAELLNEALLAFQEAEREEAARNGGAGGAPLEALTSAETDFADDVIASMRIETTPHGDDDDAAGHDAAGSAAARRSGGLRYMNWNIEWMDHFFKSDTEFHTSVPGQDIENCDAVLKRIATVIVRLQPDLLAVTEGPLTLARMRLFVKHYLNDSFTCVGLDSPPLPDAKRVMAEYSPAIQPAAPPAAATGAAEPSPLSLDGGGGGAVSGNGSSPWIAKPTATPLSDTTDSPNLSAAAQPQSYRRDKAATTHGVAAGQELYFLVRKAGPVKDVELFREADDYLKQPWQFDVRGDLTLKEYYFTRRPLIIRGRISVSIGDADDTTGPSAAGAGAGAGAGVGAGLGAVSDSAMDSAGTLFGCAVNPTLTTASAPQNRRALTVEDFTSPQLQSLSSTESATPSDPITNTNSTRSMSDSLGADEEEEEEEDVDVMTDELLLHDLHSMYKNVYACVMHAKSKYISRGRRLWLSRDPQDKQEFIRKAVQNRRRIAAECLRLRTCLDKFVFQREANPFVIVSGDTNDGPGMDFFEQKYTLRDSVDSLLGSPFYRKQMLRALLISSRFVPPSAQWSIVFDDFVDNKKDKRVLLDHIFVSRALWRLTRRATIAHTEYESVSTGTDRQSRPSDHRPVYADFL